MGLEDRRKIGMRYVEVLPLGRVKDLPLSPNISGWSSLSGEVPGPEFLARCETLPKIFSPPLKFTIDNVVAEGDSVAVQCHSKGMLINGVEYTNEYHYLFKFEGDLLLKVYEYVNAKKAEVLFAALQSMRGKA